jgi:hypothetical protein
MRTRRGLTLGFLAVAVRAIIASAQAPSQRQLNGFLIGQSDDAIAAHFTVLMQADTTPDGWVNRVYLLDRAHHAYMAFKFPKAHPHETISVQIAGDSDTEMVPFLGIRLGDHPEALLPQLGRPSRVSHENDVNVDLYEYAGRNYSIEVDSNSRVSSIQVFGTEGIPDWSLGTMPVLDGLWEALEIGGRTAMEALASDAEIYRHDSTVSFRHGALADLQTGSTSFAQALLRGPQSVRAIIADSSVRHRAEGAIRVWLGRPPGWVWRFAAPTPISQLVFVRKGDHWRLWEVQYR